MASIAGSYAVFDKNGVRLEVMGGIRGWDIETSIKLINQHASMEETIVDPFVGFRFAAPVTKRISFYGMANYGSGDSDHQVDAVAQLKWKWKESIDLAGGCRYLSLDFEDCGFLIDAKLHGPFAAITFNF